MRDDKDRADRGGQMLITAPVGGGDKGTSKTGSTLETVTSRRLTSKNASNYFRKKSRNRKGILLK